MEHAPKDAILSALNNTYSSNISTLKKHNDELEMKVSELNDKYENANKEYKNKLDDLEKKINMLSIKSNVLDTSVIFTTSTTKKSPRSITKTIAFFVYCLLYEVSTYIEFNHTNMNVTITRTRFNAFIGVICKYLEDKKVAIPSTSDASSRKMIDLTGETQNVEYYQSIHSTMLINIFNNLSDVLKAAIILIVRCVKQSRQFLPMRLAIGATVLREDIVYLNKLSRNDNTVFNESSDINSYKGIASLPAKEYNSLVMDHMKNIQLD